MAAWIPRATADCRRLTFRCALTDPPSHPRAFPLRSRPVEPRLQVISPSYALPDMKLGVAEGRKGARMGGSFAGEKRAEWVAQEGERRRNRRRMPMCMRQSQLNEGGMCVTRQVWAGRLTKDADGGGRVETTRAMSRRARPRLTAPMDAKLTGGALDESRRRKRGIEVEGVVVQIASEARPSAHACSSGPTAAKRKREDG